MWPAAAQHATRRLKVEFDREEDGRWIAEIPELPGVLVYGANQQEAWNKVIALSLRVLADQLEESAATTQDIEAGATADLSANVQFCVA